MFIGCSSLIFLNLFSFKLKNSARIDYALNGVPLNTKICIKDEQTKKILFGNQTRVDCSDICFNKNIIIDTINKKCLHTSCLDEGNKYVFKNECFRECPENTYIIFNNILENNLDKIECFALTPQGYYLDTKNKAYKKCFSNCKYCYGEGNETINNCNECISGLVLLNESKYYTNCYMKCDSFYYFDELGQYYCS